MAAVVLSSLVMLVKLTVESGVSFGEVLFWRQAPTVVILLGWLALRGQISRFRTRRLPIHARRALLGMIGMLCTFGTPVLLPLAEATTLGFTTPLFAVILAAFLLRERVGPWRWLAVALGFAGVILIANPGQANWPPLGTALGIAGGLMVALISIQVRDLAQTDEPLTVVFWFATISTPVFALLLPWFATPHNATQWLLLLGCGLLGLLGQLLLTASLRYGQVASVIVMDYSALVWSTLFGWLIWDHLPTSATWFGAPLIVAAGLLIAWREHVRHKPVGATGSALGE